MKMNKPKSAAFNRRPNEGGRGGPGKVRRDLAWTAPPLKNLTPWEEIYRSMVGQMNTGACLEPATLFLNIVETRGESRDSRFFCAELSGEERGHSFVRLPPGGVPQESMDFVRKHEFLERDILLLEPAREIHCLLKLHIAVIVPVDEKHRRFPVRDRIIR